MKKFINHQDHLTTELLEGMCAAFPKHLKLVKEKLVCRAEDKARDKVAIMSMGGSGHEPLEGFVGPGWLDCFVSGDIFAAPGPHTVLEAMRLLKRDAGILLVTLNHAGDVLSANMAKQMAAMEGIKVREILTREEIRPTEGEEGRGLGGCVLLYKIVGAAAEKGWSLDEVCRVGEKFNNQMAAIAVLSEVATHPATGGQCGEMGEKEMEICAGQHGEGGGVRMAMMSAKNTAELLAGKVIAKLGLKAGDEIVLAINGSGKATLMELFITFNDAKKFFESRKIRVVGSHVGEMLTVQEAGGYQMLAAKMDAELKDLWNAPSRTPFFCS